MKNYLIELEKKVSDYFIFLKLKGYNEIEFKVENWDSDSNKAQSLSKYPGIEVIWQNKDLQKKIILIIYKVKNGLVPIFKFQNLITEHKFADYDYFAAKYKTSDTYENIQGKDNLDRLIKYFDIIKLEFDKDQLVVGCHK